MENGIIYVLGEDDIYYPDLRLPEGANYEIEKFGYMRCEYLKEFKHGCYMVLAAWICCLTESGMDICMRLMRNVNEMMDRIVKQMKEK